MEGGARGGRRGGPVEGVVARSGAVVDGVEQLPVEGGV